MNTILISVIVPSYNQGKYLTETLESVLNQTFSFWECIIINDGSNDNTDVVAKAFCNRDKRFKYIYQQNQGVCIARNNAINNAQGDYILCLDGDDKLSSNFLSLTVPVLENNVNVKIVTPLTQLFDRVKRLYLLPKYSINLLLARNLFIMTSLFRKADFVRCGGFNINMKQGFEDWDFWISVMSEGGEVVSVPEAVFYYRKLKNSRNSSISKETFGKLRRQIWENHKELYAINFIDPAKSFEYELIEKSKEYKVGCKVLSPIRKIMKLLY